MRRVIWYVLLAGIGTVFAEGLSWNTPLVWISPLVPLIYGLHYALIVDFLLRRCALTIPALAVGGLVLGLGTESLMTKVIWNPPWDGADDMPSILGLRVFAVFWVCATWHVWMSTAIPLALAFRSFGHADLLSDRAARRILLLLPLTMGVMVAINQTFPWWIIPAMVANGAGILVLAWLYQRWGAPSELTMTRAARVMVGIVLVALYALLLNERPEAWPSVGPFILGMALLVGSLALFWRVAERDAGAMPGPGPVRYDGRALARYLVYFSVVGALSMALAALLSVVSLVIAVLIITITSLVSTAYLLRLGWPNRRIFRLSWRGAGG